MKPVRLIALGLIGVFIARQYQQNSQGTGPQPSLAKHATHRPDNTTESPAPAKRPPEHTSAAQPVSATPLTNNAPKA